MEQSPANGTVERATCAGCAARVAELERELIVLNGLVAAARDLLAIAGKVSE